MALHYGRSGIGWAQNRSTRIVAVHAVAFDRKRLNGTWRPMTEWVLQLGLIDVVIIVPAVSSVTLAAGRQSRSWWLRGRMATPK